ncbi:hypothetical protein PINS_up022832 [Pythium insidiosum]|nr:hypothetical protein PINS_up022832 [Pythium insidiosum]
MKKTNGLSGIGAVGERRHNFAASCVLGAIQQNQQSALCKLSGVDLSLVIASLPSSDAEKQALLADKDARDGAAPRRAMDVLARNERVLKSLQNHRALLAVAAAQAQEQCRDDDCRRGARHGAAATAAPEGPRTTISP